MVLLAVSGLLNDGEKKGGNTHHLADVLLGKQPAIPIMSKKIEATLTLVKMIFLRPTRVMKKKV